MVKENWVESRIQKLVTQYKCLQKFGDFVKK